MSTTRKILYTLLLVGLIAGIVSCNSVRKATYPAGFVYLDSDEVHSAMQKMAISIDRLDHLLQQTSISTEVNNEQVLTELRSIKHATDDMAAPASLSSHRVISDNIGRFRSRVDSAIQLASAQPPDYTLTSNLVNQCLDCHVKDLRHSNEF